MVLILIQCGFSGKCDCDIKDGKFGIYFLCRPTILLIACFMLHSLPRIFSDSTINKSIRKLSFWCYLSIIILVYFIYIIKGIVMFHQTQETQPNPHVKSSWQRRKQTMNNIWRDACSASGGSISCKTFTVPFQFLSNGVR